MILPLPIRPTFSFRLAALVAGVLLGTMFTPASASAGPLASRDASPRVRALDAKTAQLLEDGKRRSPTFKRLLGDIERSDLIVHVGMGLVAGPAETTFVTKAGETRFLRIMLSVPEADDRLLAWLGHELQHAVEIAGAPEVTDAVTLSALYRRIGYVISEDSVCTAEAQQVTADVRAEVAFEQ